MAMRVALIIVIVVVVGIGGCLFALDMASRAAQLISPLPPGTQMYLGHPTAVTTEQPASAAAWPSSDESLAWMPVEGDVTVGPIRLTLAEQGWELARFMVKEQGTFHARLRHADIPRPLDINFGLTDHLPYLPSQLARDPLRDDFGARHEAALRAQARDRLGRDTSISAYSADTVTLGGHTLRRVRFLSLLADRYVRHASYFVFMNGFCVEITYAAFISQFEEIAPRFDVVIETIQPSTSSAGMGWSPNADEPH